MNRYELFFLSLLFSTAEASTDISHSPYFDNTSNTSSTPTKLDIQIILASLTTKITHEAVELLDSERFSYPEKSIAIAVSLAHIPATGNANVPAMAKMSASQIFCAFNNLSLGASLNRA